MVAWSALPRRVTNLAAKKKSPTKPANAKSAEQTIQSLISYPLAKLERRVDALEEGMSELRSTDAGLAGQITAMQHTIKQVDERTLRGEKLMMEMQHTQLKTNRLLEQLLVVSKPVTVVVSPRVPPDMVKVVEEVEALADGDAEPPPTPK